MIMLGQYLLLRQIGDGGFGEVWEALDPHGGRVAIKKLHERASWCLSALRDEAQKLWLLRGTPGVVHLLDHQLEDSAEEPFLVLELAEGSLADRIHGPMSPEQVLPIGQQIAAVLGEIHARGVVHRDLKPDNILLRGGLVHIADFGIARGNRSLLLTVGGAGTPGYMAPEQESGQPTWQSDVYSFGATLFHLITGERPRGTQGLLDPRRLVPGCPAGLAQLVVAMTAPDPQHRPALPIVKIKLDELVASMRTRQRAANAPRNSGATGLFAGVAGVAGLIVAFLGVAAAANMNSYDGSAQRYRGRDGRFRRGRFG